MYDRIEIAGRVAESGHPDNLDDIEPRDNEEPQDSGDAQRTPHVVPAHQQNPRVRPGLVHVSGQHRAHVLQHGIPRGRR